MHHLKLLPIIKDLLDIQLTGKANVHIDFSGHVDKIAVIIYIPKWERDKDPDFTFEAYVDTDRVETDRSWVNFEKQVNSFIRMFKLLNTNQ